MPSHGRGRRFKPCITHQNCTIKSRAWKKFQVLCRFADREKINDLPREAKDRLDALAWHTAHAFAVFSSAARSPRYGAATPSWPSVSFFMSHWP